MTSKRGKTETPSSPSNGDYCDGSDSKGSGVPKSKPVDPAENRKTKNASDA